MPILRLQPPKDESGLPASLLQGIQLGQQAKERALRASLAIRRFQLEQRRAALAEDARDKADALRARAEGRAEASQRLAKQRFGLEQKRFALAEKRLEAQLNRASQDPRTKFLLSEIAPVVRDPNFGMAFVRGKDGRIVVDEVTGEPKRRPLSIEERTRKIESLATNLGRTYDLVTGTGRIQGSQLGLQQGRQLGAPPESLQALPQEAGVSPAPLGGGAPVQGGFGAPAQGGLRFASPLEIPFLTIPGAIPNPQVVEGRTFEIPFGSELLARSEVPTSVRNPITGGNLPVSSLAPERLREFSELRLPPTLSNLPPEAQARARKILGGR